MKPNPTTPQKIAIFAIVSSLCWFVIVIAYKWVAHELPTNTQVVVFSLGGMSVVGAVAGFVVSALANVAFRAGPSALCMPLTAFAWTAFCAASTTWLFHTAVDGGRLLVLCAIAAICGLLVGPYHAELFVGSWLYKRRAFDPPR